ncbi:MAG: UDP-N-acetylglucosamine 1-carboxyvinyltransferase [Patescibacteria group bacterium]|nr:UDP-N-acetylglucosamine 1-carboxyvinyltransferase [Patescibacteria group bacterium]MDE2015592.1 UDP-N-acetylglucosamine 1-carboxyvinyltransferase [Patescibacteria group bacterium]MDE2226649.1 UDP-N-acetylglucosamine 1-carboxyvinyltransferase [Patescibacteria group bacterium]
MKFIIRGGKRLAGTIEVNGAKNSVLKAMAASLLFSNPITIKNTPFIEDVLRMRELLEDLGAKVEEGDRMLVIDPTSVRDGKLNKEIAERLRASIVLAGPLLARNGWADFPYPGGCVIGKRPIDIFLSGWQAMGAKIMDGKDHFRVTAKKLRGADFAFRVVSVTGTETMMMTAALASGKTVLRNAAMEPEILSLADFLNDSGAKISGAGTPKIEIIGTGGRLLRAKRPFTVIPDRIEAGSFLILGAAIGKKIKVAGCEPEHMTAIITALREANVPLEIGKDFISVSKPRNLKAVNVQTREYPGFPTDLQAPFAVLMTQAEGESVIFETIWESRFGYAENLKRMGANIFLADQHRILIKGPHHLRGREIESPDLRAGLALIVAALLAKGESVISNIYQIDRGYEKIDERLRELSAEIQRIN